MLAFGAHERVEGPKPSLELHKQLPRHALPRLLGRQAAAGLIGPRQPRARRVVHPQGNLQPRTPRQHATHQLLHILRLGEELGGRADRRRVVELDHQRAPAQALRAFEQRYVHELEGVAARVDAGTADEVVQRLRDRLLVGPEAKLRDYAGTGSLRRWLKVATKRQALDLQRGIGRRRESGSVAVDSFASKVDPELDYIKAHYRAEFREAFASAMQDLEPRSRTMLRLHLVHSLSIDEIAPMHQVHRATVARWIARARSELAERTRAELALRLGVETSEVESVIHLIASRMDITVTRHLQSLSGVDPDSAPQ